MKHTVTAKSFVLTFHLVEMFGYATVLRSASQGRGTFMMVFDHYEDVPKSVQEEIIKKTKVKTNQSSSRRKSLSGFLCL